jgi:hypothetical protein
MANPLNNVPGWRDFADDAALLAHLLATGSTPSNRGRLTHEKVSEHPLLGLAVADAIYGAINSVSPPSAVRYNVGSGIDTSAELWKQQAEAVAEQNAGLAPFLELLRDWELDKGPLWELLQIEFLPTIEDVAAWRLDADTRLARDQIIERITAVQSAIAQAETPEAVLADAEAAWAGDAE